MYSRAERFAGLGFAHPGILLLASRTMSTSDAKRRSESNRPSRLDKTAAEERHLKGAFVLRSNNWTESAIIFSLPFWSCNFKMFEIQPLRSRHIGVAVSEPPHFDLNRWIGYLVYERLLHQSKTVIHFYTFTSAYKEVSFDKVLVSLSRSFHIAFFSSRNRKLYL